MGRHSSHRLALRSRYALLRSQSGPTPPNGSASSSALCTVDVRNSAWKKSLAAALQVALPTSTGGIQTLIMLFSSELEELGPKSTKTLWGRNLGGRRSQLTVGGLAVAAS